MNGIPKNKFDANSYLEQAQMFQEHFVKPLINEMKSAIDAQLAPLVADVQEVKNTLPRIDKLEANQRKALAVYGGICGFGGLLGGILWELVRRHLLHMS
jgi:hypothetical protein